MTTATTRCSMFSPRCLLTFNPFALLPLFKFFTTHDDSSAFVHGAKWIHNSAVSSINENICLLSTATENFLKITVCSDRNQKVENGRLYSTTMYIPSTGVNWAEWDELCLNFIGLFCSDKFQLTVQNRSFQTNGKLSGSTYC